MRKNLCAAMAIAIALCAVSVRVVSAQVTVLYSFENSLNGYDGATPKGSLVFDKAGNLYGTTELGGNGSAAGTVYELSPPTEAGGDWTEKVIYNFQGGADGDEPVGALLIDAKGNLYGISQGGTSSSGGAAGVIFYLSPPSSASGKWAFHEVYTFAGSTEQTKGGLPVALTVDAKGNFFGACALGGANFSGGVFEVSPPAKSGGEWTERLIYSFPSSGTGWLYQNTASLIFDAKGNLYGTSTTGNNGNGAVYELSPGAGGEWTFTDIADLDAKNAGPSASLVFDKDGNLYTTASGQENTPGTVFELSPPSSEGAQWTAVALYPFKGGASDGKYPQGGVIFDSKGNLYGTASMGGPYYLGNKANTDGALFELTPSAGGWQEHVLHFFGSTSSDAIQPATPLLLDSKGNLYGVGEGGVHGDGAVFEYKAVPTAGTPTFSPVPGTYATKQMVEIKSATAGATIYYTTNGAAPTTSSAKYSVPIAVTRTETIEAIAIATGYGESAIASAHYFIGKAANTPSILPPSSTHISDVIVKISDATVGAAIYYTTNGTTPTAASKKYILPFKLTHSATVKAIAIGSDGVPSKEASAAYIVKTAEPVISPDGGTFKAVQMVTIKDATPGAAIYFTTNGATPSAHSKRYTAPIKVGAKETIKAIATLAGQTPSAIAAATFTFN